jgi:hypothetical protein
VGIAWTLIVAETVVVELKTVDHLAPVHDALLRNGIHRRVLGLEE